MSHRIEPTASLDTTGLRCPIPVLRAKKILATLNIGDILAVRTTDPLALIDIPHMCNEFGYHLLLTRKELDYCIFYIEKSA